MDIKFLLFLFLFLILAFSSSSFSPSPSSSSSSSPSLLFFVLHRQLLRSMGKTGRDRAGTDIDGGICIYFFDQEKVNRTGQVVGGREINAVLLASKSSISRVRLVINLIFWMLTLTLFSSFLFASVLSFYVSFALFLSLSVAHLRRKRTGKKKKKDRRKKKETNTTTYA